MKHLVLTTLILLSCLSSFAQRSCGAMENLQHQLATNPDMAIRMEAIENQTQHFVQSGGDHQRTLITIPVERFYTVFVVIKKVRLFFFFCHCSLKFFRDILLPNFLFPEHLRCDAPFRVLFAYHLFYIESKYNKTALALEI